MEESKYENLAECIFVKWIKKKKRNIYSCED